MLIQRWCDDFGNDELKVYLYEFENIKTKNAGMDMTGMISATVAIYITVLGRTVGFHLLQFSNLQNKRLGWTPPLNPLYLSTSSPQRPQRNSETQASNLQKSKRGAETEAAIHRENQEVSEYPLSRTPHYLDPPYGGKTPGLSCRPIFLHGVIVRL